MVIPPMSDALVPTVSNRDLFKGYLRKIGSGEHTSKGLTREEAAHALELILDEQASPAQIGAFLIAHRIRRPEPQELTGMLDVYRQRGPKLSSTAPAISFGMPFDGRTRTAPIYPLTALLLSAAGLPVVLQGAGRMPVKYGVTAQELFAAMGIDWSRRSLQWLQESLELHQLALIHQPDQFRQQKADQLSRRSRQTATGGQPRHMTAHQGDHLGEWSTTSDRSFGKPQTRRTGTDCQGTEETDRPSAAPASPPKSGHTHERPILHPVPQLPWDDNFWDGIENRFPRP